MTQPRLQLYGYWRSSAAYRVRIALNLKGLAYEPIAVHLTAGGGQQHQPDYAALNPQHLVPTLVHGDFVLSQSLAILQYLEDLAPTPTLLPEGLRQRARMWQICQAIASDIHPIDNLRVLNYLKSEFNVGDDERQRWYLHWVKLGFDALETTLTKTADAHTPFCCGSQPTLADCCLVPQVYNARRYSLDLTPYPCIVAIDARCNDLAAFRHAAPEAQPDAIQPT